MTEKQLIKVNSRKFDGRIHRSWNAELIEKKDDLYIFFGVFDFEVDHPKLGIVRQNTLSYEYYWKNKWFNVFRFHEPEGGLRNFYCNIIQPPIVEGGSLNYVDLDIDVVIWKDFSYEVLDIDEFDENTLRYGYSVDVQKQAYLSLSELIQLIENRNFPFDYMD